MKTLESLGVVIVVVGFVFFNFYVVRELGLLTADVRNINSGLTELRRESYRVADLQTSNAELNTKVVEVRGNISAIESQMGILAAFALATNDEVEMLINSSLGSRERIVIITKRPTGTPAYNIPESMKEIQNLSEPSDYWGEFCFQERKTNTTLCYRKV
jgi:flagellar biogenesis protein FliO